MRRVLLALFVVGVASAAPEPLCVSNHAPSPDSNVTIIGGNQALSEGAAALEEGRVEDGIRLTLEGLKSTNDIREMAAGQANLCAGFAILRLWEVALPYCNEALGLDDSNWRAFNNRAAVFAGKGQYDLALADLHSGLAIAPHSPTLRESLRVVLQNRRRRGGRDRVAALS